MWLIRALLLYARVPRPSLAETSDGVFFHSEQVAGEA